MKVRICFILAFLMLGLVSTLEIEETHDGVKGKLKQLRRDVDELYDIIDAQKKTIQGLKNAIKSDILAHIKKNGIYLGNRWRIAEEGTGSYEALVFRDITSTNAGTDRRYAFFKNRYTDL